MIQSAPPYPAGHGTKSQGHYKKYVNTSYNDRGTKLSLFGAKSFGYFLVGTGEKKQNCGKYLSTRVYDDGSTRQKYIHCDRSTCPVCFMDWVKKIAKRTSERIFDIEHSLFAKSKPKKRNRFKHLTFSPDVHNRYWKEPEKFRKQMKEELKKWGVTRAVYAFHPFRRINSAGPYTEDNVYYSPHFHIVTPQYIAKYPKRGNRNGWLLKNHGERKGKGNKDLTERIGTIEALNDTISYILSHAGTTEKRNHHVIRNIGEYARSKKDLVEETEQEYKDYVLLEGRTFLEHKPMTEVQLIYKKGLDQAFIPKLDDEILTLDMVPDDDIVRMMYMDEGTEKKRKYKYTVILTKKRAIWFRDHDGVLK